MFSFIMKSKWHWVAEKGSSVRNNFMGDLLHAVNTERTFYGW